MENRDWYNNINKSPLTPPNWVFGTVWPILYVLLGISFLKISNNENCKGLCLPLVFFLIQMVLNVSWTTVFFRYKKTKIALIMILVIIGLTYKTYEEMKLIDTTASNLLIPYLVWLSFATYLNGYIVMNN